MILCVGTTPALQRTMVFKHVVLGEVNRAEQVVESAAGKGPNVALALVNLKQEAILTGFIGGRRGDILLADLNRRGVKHDLVPTAASTRLCTTIIDYHSHTELVEESPAATVEEWQSLRAKLTELTPRSEMMTLSGTLPAGGPVEFYRDCCQLAAEAGIGVILDARGEALLKALPARPLVAKPNRAELAATVNAGLDSIDEVRAAMHKLIELGAQWAVVTMGRDGALITDGKQFWLARPPSVKVLNTIGSGDSFTAGLAAGILRGQSIPEAAKLATAAAAANAATLIPAHFTTNEVKKLEKQVVVQRV